MSGAPRCQAARPIRRPRCAPRAAVCVLVGMLLIAGCAPSAAPRSDTGAPAAPASAPAAAPQPPAPIHLVGNYSARGVGQAGFWLAYEGGYFREQGLDVELTNITSTSPVIQAMVAGEVHISGIDAAASIQATLGGADVVLLFAGSNRPVFSVMSQPAIQDPQALRGKVIGITRLGSATHSAALIALGMWGLVPDRDVAFRQLNQVPAILAALQAGQVDAGILSLPSRVLARRAGYRELINLTTHGPDYPSIVITALRPWLEANEEAVRRFARAYVQGFHRARTDKAWALEVFRKYLETDDPEILDEGYEEFLSCCPRVPYISEEGIARLLADLAAEEPRLAGRQPAEFIDSRFLRELENSGFIQQVMGPAR